MGQRLVISVKEKGEEVACLYYHWSAYSYSALWETEKLLEYLEDNKDVEAKLACLRFAQQNGGGVRGTAEEIEYAKNLFPNEQILEDGYSRNNGLVAFSEEGRNDFHLWSEGDVEIDLDKREIHNTVLYWADSLDTIRDEGWFVDDFEVFETEQDIEVFPFEDLEIVMGIVDNNVENVVHTNEGYYGFIY